MMAAFSRDDLVTARTEQYRSVQLIEVLAGFGYLAAAKAVMGLLGVDVGSARLPNTNLTPEQRTGVHKSLERLGFFDWIRS
jgi:N-acetylneuraminate lyase